MSKDQCPRCGNVFSTTESPSNDLGYFLSDADMEKLDENLFEQGIFMVDLFIKKNKLKECLKCPKCGKVSLYSEKYEPQGPPQLGSTTIQEI